jgi:hypothetical protein
MIAEIRQRRQPSCQKAYISIWFVFDKEYGGRGPCGLGFGAFEVLVDAGLEFVHNSASLLLAGHFLANALHSKR